ncbi:MAG: methylated-DNA--[protein]-cysteine S-methyltransferase [Anaerolineae bacterium]
MKIEYKTIYHSAIGPLEIVGTETAITQINFMDTASEAIEKEQSDMPSVITDCISQLAAYFQGERQEFLLPLEPKGTEFQQSVWCQLLAIPYGQTVSYLNIARQLHNEKAIRAVGAANGQNPIVIVIPCHRVIGSNGQLTGYGGGLWRKAWLLQHEKQFSSPQLALF